MYSGEVPRDFDSVWGDDDQSKITIDGSVVSGGLANTGGNGNAYFPPNSAEFNSNLQELTEHNEPPDTGAEFNSGSFIPEPAGRGHGGVPRAAPAGAGVADGAEGASAGAEGCGEQSTVNLGEFDSGSEGGSTSRKGAFTLELLGEGPSYAGRGAAGGPAAGGGGDAGSVAP